MIVTTNSIITDRPSTRMPTSKSVPPDCHHVQVFSTGGMTTCDSPSADSPPLLAWPRPRRRRRRPRRRGRRTRLPSASVVGLRGGAGGLARCGDRRGRRGRRVLDALGGVDVVDVADPLVAGAEGQHEAGRQRGDAELGALVWAALAEAQDEEERQERDQREQPGVLEDPSGAVGDLGRLLRALLGQRCCEQHHGRASPLHQAGGLEVDRGPVAVDHQDDGRARRPPRPRPRR